MSSISSAENDPAVPAVTAGQEMLSEHEQWAYFVAIHGIMSVYPSMFSTRVQDRPKLERALLAAPAQSTDFPAMAAFDSRYESKTSLSLTLSSPYPSALEHDLEGFGSDFDETHWAAPAVAPINPYNVLRMWRTKDGAGRTSSVGLYVAQHRLSGDLAYFALREKAEAQGHVLQVDTVDEPLRIALSHELRLGAEVMHSHYGNGQPSYNLGLLDFSDYPAPPNR